MTREEFLDNYWRFYLILEDRFMNTVRYVELCENNYRTHSMEFVSLLREFGSELDVIMKVLCEFDLSERKNIADYARILLVRFPEIREQKIVGKRITIQPYKDWTSENASASLEWWQAYNDIKHGRVLNYEKANLKNVFYSLGALFILGNYLLMKIAREHSDIDIPDKESSLFRMIDWETDFISSQNTISQFYE